MFRNIPLIRFLSLIVIIFLIAGLMGKGAAADIGRYLLSLAAYTCGVLAILWALTQGRSKNSKKKEEDKQEKP